MGVESPHAGQSYSRREDDVDRRSERAEDDADRESSDRRKHRAGKSRKPSSGDDMEDLDGSGRRRNGGDRYEGRKRSADPKGGSDEDDYDSRKESRSQSKKKQEESSLERLSTWYQDGEESKQDKGHDRGDESEKRKGTPKSSENDTHHSKGRSRHERSYEGDRDKMSERDVEYAERKESGRKGHGSSEQSTSSRRRGDDVDANTKAEEANSEKNDGRSGKASDNRHDLSRDKTMMTPKEPFDNKGRLSDSNSDKGTRSFRKDERRHDGKSRSTGDTVDEDNKGSPSAYDDRVSREKNEKFRQPRTPTVRDTTDNRDKPSHPEEDSITWPRDRNARSHRSRTPDRGGRYAHERPEERPYVRSGGRKDGSRGEAVKTSSNYGISNDNYDVIEIQTKPIDYANTEVGSGHARRYEVGQQTDTRGPSNGEWGRTREERARFGLNGSTLSGDDSKEKYSEDDPSMRELNSRRDDVDSQGGRDRGQKGHLPRAAGGQSFSGSSQPPHGIQDGVSFNRAPNQGLKGNRPGRMGRGRPTGRENTPVTIPVPIMGASFGPLGLPPPGPMAPSMSPAPGPPISPGVFIPPFPPPLLWPGARGVDVNMLGVPPGLSSLPPGPGGPRFPPNMATPPNPGMYFNQAGPGRGGPPNLPGPIFNGQGPPGQSHVVDKSSRGWVPPGSGGPSKAPSRGEQNDYSQNFVDTGMRPQNFIRELELTNVVEDYPKLRELIQKKDEIVAKAATPPMYYKCDLREFELTPEFFGTKFDVILIDPPWEEYVHRAPGVADHMEYWTFEEILNLKIEAIADTPSFIFLWVGDGVGLEQGRQCLKKWGFRRCEDICWVKTNKTTATPGLRHDAHTLFQHSKEHCLMGIKGTVRRSTDGHIIHANIDTDVIIAEEPPYGSTQKPEDMYRIVEHFALGRRRLELFGEDHNIRAGWLTLGKELSSSNFNAEAYVKNFTDKDGKVWQGGGGRNPPPEAPHLVVTTPDIEALRPKSPMKNQQQMQQNQSSSISLTAASSSLRRPSPQNANIMGMGQEASGSNMSTPSHWPSSMEVFRAPDGGSGGSLPGEEAKAFDIYGYGMPPNNEYMDFEPHRALNL
ncbi:hypothetical protein MLD38_015374 [Melastoma candidum]|uniref:Uncharacterized protein n=1 Tax=Melastoma candidum TaxID=119954 RepID=A0ACB9RG06_9MYRT|nr:hypothetical protein MLD38_015374 [Melastoma candidum]